ncbi:MAG: amidohydrolase [Acidobacteria bacterium]|nr:amidohydrolase [Acidobacteriota bacterium]
MPVIDFHNHYYPPNYMKALQSGQSSVKVTIDGDGNPNLHYPGDYNVAVRGHRDLAYRQEVLDTHGVTMQVVTLTTPGTHVETPAVAAKLASMVNDEFKEAVDTRGHHFTSLATLPLNDPAASAKEFDRATRQLGLPGAMLFSNVNGVALSDERFWPIYERANDRGAVLYIHPAHPVNVDMMQEYWLMPLVGFLFDTTLAAASLVFAGVPERYPKISWALCHLGGAIPYLAERLDRGFHAFRDCRQHIQREPSSYLKEFYYDTVNFNQGALKLAIDFAGADHILSGSDYPHQIGSIPSMLEAVSKLPVTDEQREGIRWKNAAKILGLKM